jgi:formylglycine-generating enzyme required for sulfatase activity
MGSPESEEGRHYLESPPHEVTVTQGFHLGKYEITQGQWESAMATTPWSGNPNVEKNPDHPAVYVSWDDVQEFIQLLNAASGEGLYRLPTEAEWEYACRAGTTTRWSFGDDEGQSGEYSWYRDNAWNAGLQYPQPVGTNLANPWGLHDMHGNVCEWVQDWFGDYVSGSQVNPQGPSTGPNRVFRGGSFLYFTPETRSASRGHCVPYSRIYSIGARLLRTR